MAQNRTEQILIRVTPKERKEIEDIAWMNRMTMSEALRQGIQRLRPEEQR